MLGSAADAEDVLQETWLRWADVDHGRGARAARLPGPDHHPPRAQPDPHAGPAPRVLRRAVAARAAAHLARRGRGRRARRQRLDRDAAGAGDARRRPSGRCSCCARSSTCRTTRSRPPSTRAPAAVRQIAHRARSHVEARRPRQQVTPAEQTAVVERFLAAVSTGDIQGLLDVLSPDVVLITDGGGQEAGRAAPDPRRREGAPVPRRGHARRRLGRGRPRPSSTAARACGCCSATSSTPSPPCGSTTAWSPSSTSSATPTSSAGSTPRWPLTR